MTEIRTLRQKLFSVMQRHDELPEMSLPLTVLMMLGCVLFSMAAGKLATPAEPFGKLLTAPDYIGIAAAVLFLPAVACMYASIILLWRKVASLLVTPICFAAMLWADVRLFPAVTMSLSLLFCAYVYATSLISRETKFRRMTALASAAGICTALTVAAYVSLYFGSFTEFFAWYMDTLPEAMAQVYLNAGQTVPAADLSAGCRQLLMMVPAYTVVLAIALAWITEFLMHTLFRVLGCEEIFIETSRKITMPVSYAVVYAVSFILTMMTPAESYPFLHILLNSITCAMILPCAAIGLDGVRCALEEKLYYVTGERLLAVMILAVAFGILGMNGFVIALSACGAYYVIRNRMKREE